MSVQLERPLNARQALVCETARAPRCLCRCGGVFHGTRRSELSEFYEQLPAEDPHWIKEKSRQLPLPRPVGVDR